MAAGAPGQPHKPYKPYKDTGRRQASKIKEKKKAKAKQARLEPDTANKARASHLPQGGQEPKQAPTSWLFRPTEASDWPRRGYK